MQMSVLVQKLRTKKIHSFKIRCNFESTHVIKLVSSKYKRQKTLYTKSVNHRLIIKFKNCTQTYKF
jgi:hypothetical protein